SLTTFCVSPDLVFGVGRDAPPVVLDRRTGRRLRSLRGAPELMGEWLADARGGAAFSAMNGCPQDGEEVVAFDLSGRRLWRRKEPLAPCALLHDSVLGLDVESRFVVLDRADGKRRATFPAPAWTFEPEFPTDDPPLPTAVAVARDVIYVGD